jgi:hypothetical protein
MRKIPIPLKWRARPHVLDRERMPIGMYRGELIATVPPEYAAWVSENLTTIPDWLREKLKARVAAEVRAVEPCRVKRDDERIYLEQGGHLIVIDIDEAESLYEMLDYLLRDQTIPPAADGAHTP